LFLIKTARFIDKNLKDFKNIYYAQRRIRRILPKDFKKKQVNPSLFTTEEEKRLYEFAKGIRKEDISLSFEKLEKLSYLLDRLFEKVLIMEKDKELRENRLNLLALCDEKFSIFARFDLLQL